MIPITELPPTHRTYGGIHLTLDSSSGKVIIEDFVHLTPYTQAQLNAKINNTVGDLAIGSDVDNGGVGISIWNGTIWKCASTSNVGPKVAFYDPTITSSSPVFFSIPTNITRLKITAVGAGGGGAAGLATTSGTASIGGTGGAGATVIAWIENLVAGDTVEVYAGLSGSQGLAGGAGSAKNGQNGTNTTVVITRTDSTVQTITAGSGRGGVYSGAGTGASGIGGQGAVTNITASKHIIIDGNPGTTVISGGSNFGPYVVANTSAGTGANAVKYGSGGGNGYDTDTSGFNGGFGSNGCVSIEY
jgi:hypothetical protein